MSAPPRNAVAFLTPFPVFMIKRGFRPLRRATKGLCPLETRKPLKRLDLNFTVTLFVQIFLFSRFIGKLKCPAEKICGAFITLCIP